ncbi:uncharacterized protein FFNC_15723 [Fusarium fujikuroi]|nr:uncharacterized protein FFNC_15723 [Fusarium fujikuroi]
MTIGELNQPPEHLGYCYNTK